MRYQLRTLTALGLSALLALTAGPVATGTARAEAGEVVIESDETVTIDDMAADGLDALDLGDLSMDLTAPTVAPADTPTPTPTPTATPTPEPTATPAPPWITSVHYPKDKINFETEIWDIMTGKWGLTGYQAAGLMSSILAESSFSPYNAQGMGGSDDRGKYLYDAQDAVGFGLCQWTSSGRKAALLRFASARGSGDLVWDFDTQMDFMRQELDMKTLKATKTLYDAAEWAVMRYERPSQRYTNSWPGTRYEKGRRIYKNHTGKAYEEPALKFSVRSGDGKTGMTDVLKAGALVLDAETPLTLTVNSNYYWRLTQVDYDEVDEGSWLQIQCPSFYTPTRMEPCVCGYACDGDKALTLSVAAPPEAGQTYSATLRFEIYRGKREIRTVTVTATAGK
ncbi:MAG: hypothetical protein IKE17_09895 [Clostridia bacterium]|nr:hypothetical protein [Clostridia bacterium]